MWDIGIGFRDSGGEEQYRLVVDAGGSWFLKDGLGAVISGGSVVDFDTSATGSNTIELVAAGDTGYFAFNERLVSELDLSARAEGGDLFVGAGFFTEDATEEGTIAYSAFEIWSLVGLEAPAALEPSIAVDATTFPQLIAAATAESALAGPTSGDLVQSVGAATVMPIGVDVENFVARVEFINPSDATDRPWDFGIAFREQENGDHYRVTVASDGSWEYQIGLQADLAGGTVPSLSFEEGGRNVLEVVVAGDSAGFSVNGVFVSELNASELHGASDVWVGSGFHQANAFDGAITRFEGFTVWPLEAAEISGAAATPSGCHSGGLATPTAAMATPVAGGGGGEEIALRLHERDDPGIDALAVLSGDGGQTTVAVAARGATGGEVVVVHEGTCDDASMLPAFLLEDLDASGRSETMIEASLADLTSAPHHCYPPWYRGLRRCGGRRRHHQGRREPTAIGGAAHGSPPASVDALLLTGPFAVAQHELLDLAGRRLRQLPEFDGLRDLETRESVPAEIAMISASVAACPGLRVTNAFGTSPQ